MTQYRSVSFVSVGFLETDLVGVWVRVGFVVMAVLMGVFDVIVFVGCVDVGMGCVAMAVLVGVLVVVVVVVGVDVRCVGVVAHRVLHLSHLLPGGLQCEPVLSVHRHDSSLVVLTVA